MRAKHVDDGVLYKAFVGAFNVEVENKDYFMKKWEAQVDSGDILKRVIAKRFIDTFIRAKPIGQFDCELYFKLVEKITVY